MHISIVVCKTTKYSNSFKREKDVHVDVDDNMENNKEKKKKKL